MRAESSQKVLEVERHLSSSVRAAVPFFHRQAMANLYQVRSLNALRTYERAHDLHAAAKVRNGVKWHPFIGSRCLLLVLIGSHWFSFVLIGSHWFSLVILRLIRLTLGGSTGVYVHVVLCIACHLVGGEMKQSSQGGLKNDVA